MLFIIFLLFTTFFNESFNGIIKCLAHSVTSERLGELTDQQGELIQREALSIQEKAMAASKEHAKEAKIKALEARAIVLKTMEKYKTKPFSPCETKKDMSCSFQKGKGHKSSPTLSKNAQDQTVKSSQIVVFVSFSMPEESLKSLSRDLEQNSEVKLVLRGLIDDSMEKTARRIAELEGVMEINPELFDTYHIEQVPTFVLIKDGKPLAKVAGNISLQYAKELFAEKMTL